MGELMVNGPIRLYHEHIDLQYKKGPVMHVAARIRCPFEVGSSCPVLFLVSKDLVEDYPVSKTVVLPVSQPLFKHIEQVGACCGGAYRDSVIPLELLNGRKISCPAFLPVKSNDETDRFASTPADDVHGFSFRFAISNDIIDNENTVSRRNRRSDKKAAFTVLFGFFAACAETNILATESIQQYGNRRDNNRPFICRTIQNVEIKALREILSDNLNVYGRELRHRFAASELPGIEEIGREPPTLQLTPLRNELKRADNERIFDEFFGKGIRLA